MWAIQTHILPLCRSEVQLPTFGFYTQYICLTTEVMSSHSPNKAVRSPEPFSFCPSVSFFFFALLSLPILEKKSVLNKARCWTATSHHSVICGVIQCAPLTDRQIWVFSIPGGWRKGSTGNHVYILWYKKSPQIP